MDRQTGGCLGIKIISSGKKNKLISREDEPAQVRCFQAMFGLHSPLLFPTWDFTASLKEH